ncbi:MAG: DUF1587 domain-containing protein, partial [Planctomycetota bacterium]|nr:DUF1587 domain-containing protein [Planctomycetota bacterium]
MKKPPVIDKRTGQVFALLMVVALFHQPLLGKASAEEPFDAVIRPFFKKHCTKCHGENKQIKGKINLLAITSEEHLLSQPSLISEAIDAVESLDMPPETEPAIPDEVRKQLVRTLKEVLKKSAPAENPVRLRRLNRFQYNNSVKDLFRLKMDLFRLSEKLMTRHTGYLNGKVKKVPQEVNVASYALNPKAGMRDVMAFPKDLRAAHGFDNQANQLTLSPLLLDAFLRLSVSIVESPDFNEQT